VIFDHVLSGVQQRNLEQALACRVVDRTSLILDIFAQRARSAEETAGRARPARAPVDEAGGRLDAPRAAEGGGIGLRGPGRRSSRPTAG
jgi:GTP-binding protein HflX